MEPISRRALIWNAALAAGAAAACRTVGREVLPDLPATAAAPGYFEAEFGINDTLCRRVLARALDRGGDFADLFFEHTVTNNLSLEDGKVSRAASAVDLGVGIRVVKGDQVGYGFTQELTESSMAAAAATAATIAAGGVARPAGAFTGKALADAYPLKTLFTEVPLADKLPLLTGLHERCFALSPEVAVVNAFYLDEQKRILVMTSDGVKAEDLQPRSSLTALVVAERNGRRERAGWNLGGRRDFSFFTSEVLDEIAEQAVQRALRLFDAVQPPAGAMPVVLGPGITGILLHEAIGHGMEADFNRKGTSTYATMIGRTVAPPEVTILDDGTLPGYLGSINVDDEGTPGQKTVLVDNGVLASYMHDRISARHYGLPSTGNGRRESYRHVVLPRMRNTYMLAGPATPEEAVRRAGKGIYVSGVGNGQVKIGEGDFAFFVTEGRVIEDGRLGAPIKDVNIMGNGPAMLADLLVVANDFEITRNGSGACGKGGQTVPVGFGQPTVLVKSMVVGGVRG